MELKTFPPSFITANIPSPFPYHKSYASAIISSSSPTPIKSPIVHHVPPNSTTPYTLPIPRKLQLNNIIRNNSLVIEHLKPSDMNTEFISSILIHMLLPKISIYIVKFKHNNAIIQLSSKSFCDMFFSRFRSTKFNPRFSHLYIRNSLPYKTNPYILNLYLIHIQSHLNYDLYIIILTCLFYQLPYLQLSLFTGNLPSLNLNLPFPHLVISPLILIQTPHLIILLKIPTPLIFL